MDLATILNAGEHFGSRVRRNMAIGGVLALAIFAFPAYAQFTGGMTASQLQQEVQAQVAAGKSAADIARAGWRQGLRRGASPRRCCLRAST